MAILQVFTLFETSDLLLDVVADGHGVAVHHGYWLMSVSFSGSLVRPVLVSQDHCIPF